MCIRDSIGIGSKDEFGQTYEEWFITDYDCYVDGLYAVSYTHLTNLNTSYWQSHFYAYGRPPYN